MSGPVYQSIQKKLTENLKPDSLEIINESHLHAHHEPMQGVTSRETHFRVKIVSSQFEGKNLMQRHRMIYGLLNDEFAQGLHALALKTKTPKEVQVNN
ncbi:bola-like protein [Basidiobolus meristosporus CBS 931.73]|uniref:Bola-like protein n=1 Tax=Basidiobolus meristosporus CBS 931.73 TaxID=1314790 RepID=A0A1Y1Y1G4_9FUNG|nr:bola-like protein [Basidiobolus meristosporus CBS 931.73]|eukprot:ORX91847.1 bola-like protein [Basidiobolus meristosporus CBS 931.73]